MRTNQHITEPFNLDQLVEGLKKEDARNLKLTHNFKYLLFFLTPFYILIFGIAFVLEDDSSKSLGPLLFGLGFLIFAFIFRDLNKTYKTVDYGVPTTEMLRNAAKRYELWQNKTYIMIIPVLLFCFGFSFSGEEWMPGTEFLHRYFIAFGLIFLVFVISFFVGYLIWRKRQKPLREQALKLLAEIEK